MLLELDISHIAYNKLVDRILVFSKDNDIIPALKCARINGLSVFIAHITNGFKIANKLKLHSDGIREKQYKIFKIFHSKLHYFSILSCIYLYFLLYLCF